MQQQKETQPLWWWAKGGEYVTMRKMTRTIKRMILMTSNVFQTEEKYLKGGIHEKQSSKTVLA
jgi:hypothetical protein